MRYFFCWRMGRWCGLVCEPIFVVVSELLSWYQIRVPVIWAGKRLHVLKQRCVMWRGLTWKHAKMWGSVLSRKKARGQSRVFVTLQGLLTYVLQFCCFARYSSVFSPSLRYHPFY